MIDRVTKAIFNALVAQAQADKFAAPYVGELGDHINGGTTVDGGVDISLLARAAIEAMSEP